MPLFLKSKLPLTGVVLSWIQQRPLPARNGRHFKKFSSSSVHLSVSEQENIVIPERVPRTPTSILEALASTVGRDPTKFPSFCVDDPALLPHNYNEMKIYMLSEESGRRVAEDLVKSYPRYFQNDTAEPSVQDFNVSQLQHTDESEDALRERIQVEMVTEAMDVYGKLIAAETDISVETKLSFFDMLCFHNCNEPVKLETSQLYFKLRTESTQIWKPNSVLNQLYEELSSQYPQMHISLILGMSKYCNPKGAYEVYMKARQNGVLLPVEVHNAMLSSSVSRVSSSDLVWQDVVDIFTYMEEHNIRPNLETFNSVLSQQALLPDFTDRFKPAVAVIKEMENCGITPSLGSYSYLLEIVYRAKTRRTNGLLRAILEQVTTHKSDILKLRSVHDLKFYNEAMNAAFRSTDLESANALFDLVYNGENSWMAGDYNQATYAAGDYLLITLATESMENIMKTYNKMVPEIFVPHNKTYSRLMEIIGLYGGHKYLPTIYADLKLARRVYYTDVVDAFSLHMSCTDITDKGLLDELENIAEEMFAEWCEKLEKQKDVIQVITASALSNFIQLSLNRKDTEKAMEWFRRYKEKLHSESGMYESNSSSLLALLESLIEMPNEEQALDVLDVLRDMPCISNVENIIHNCKSDISPDFKEKVQLIVASMPRSSQPGNQSPPPKMQVVDFSKRANVKHGRKR